MDETISGSGQQAPKAPSPEVLSFDEKDVSLSQRPIDWELTDPQAWEALPAAEKEAIFREQNRRIYFAFRDISKALDRFVPPEDGKVFSARINELLNPNQSELTPETPQVEPSEEPAGN